MLIGVEEARKPGQHSLAVGFAILPLFAAVQGAGRCVLLCRAYVASVAAVHAPKLGVLIDGKAPRGKGRDVVVAQKLHTWFLTYVVKCCCGETRCCKDLTCVGCVGV